MIFPAQLLMAAGPSGQVVFYLDKGGTPVVRLDRVPQSEGVRAILALYALEVGAGCEGKNEQGLVECALPRELGLGANCSEKHILLVRTWFTRTPKLATRWNERDNGDAKAPGSLEDLCYRQPDTASWQNMWEIIRMDVRANIVTVDAIFFGGSQHGRSRIRYVTRYRVDEQEVIPVESSERYLESSSKSIFE